MNRVNLVGHSFLTLFAEQDKATDAISAAFAVLDGETKL